MIKNNVDTQLSYVPAQPGWYELSPSYNSDGTIYGFIEEPILCWEIESNTDCNPNYLSGSAINVYPITIDGKRGIVYPCILKRPNGTYVEQENQEFDNLDEIKKHLEKFK